MTTKDYKTRDKVIKRVVIKIGSNLLVTDDHTINIDFIHSLCAAINQFRQNGLECILVSSGSVACGLDALGTLGKLKQKSKYGNKFTIPKIQAAAAIGQSRLINNYSKALADYNIMVAQLLITYDDFYNRQRYLNIKNTVSELLENSIIPIFNENDTVSVDEITFGDNDYLSALITHLVGADLLVLMSTIDGLLDLNKNSENYNEVVDNVFQIDESIQKLIQDSTSKFGTGGMSSKISAAKKLMQTGHMLAIVNGQDITNLNAILNNKNIGTVFHPKQNNIKQKKLWLGFASRAKGNIIIDSGAADAILKNNKSLLPVGVVDLSGIFECGDIVNIIYDNKTIARGQTNYNNEEIIKIKQKKSSEIDGILGFKPYDEIILKDNMVII